MKYLSLFLFFTGCSTISSHYNTCVEFMDPKYKNYLACEKLSFEVVPKNTCVKYQDQIDYPQYACDPKNKLSYKEQQKVMGNK